MYVNAYACVCMYAYEYITCIHDELFFVQFVNVSCVSAAIDRTSLDISRGPSEQRKDAMEAKMGWSEVDLGGMPWSS